MWRREIAHIWQDHRSTHSRNYLHSNLCVLLFWFWISTVVTHKKHSHWQVTFYKILVDEFLYLTAREFCFVVPKSHNCALNLIINKEERCSKLMSFNCIAIVFPKGTHFRVSMQPCHYCLSSTKYIIGKGRSLKDGDSFEDDIRFHSNV